jgi:hypothetical protein
VRRSRRPNPERRRATSGRWQTFPALETPWLVAEFGTSGLSRGEFCRIHGMTLSTLNRGLERERIGSKESCREGKRLVRVKVIGEKGKTDREPRCAMAVVLAKGRRAPFLFNSAFSYLL